LEGTTSILQVYIALAKQKRAVRKTALVPEEGAQIARPPEVMIEFSLNRQIRENGNVGLRQVIMNKKQIRNE
jgi:hypothetical protein